jgi:hypothetical protein
MNHSRKLPKHKRKTPVCNKYGGDIKYNKKPKAKKHKKTQKSTKTYPTHTKPVKNPNMESLLTNAINIINNDNKKNNVPLQRNANMNITRLTPPPAPQASPASLVSFESQMSLKK